MPLPAWHRARMERRGTHGGQRRKVACRRLALLGCNRFLRYVEELIRPHRRRHGVGAAGLRVEFGSVAGTLHLPPCLIAGLLSLGIVALLRTPDLAIGQITVFPMDGITRVRRLPPVRRLPDPCENNRWYRAGELHLQSFCGQAAACSAATIRATISAISARR